MLSGGVFKRFCAAFLALIVLLSGMGQSWAEANLWRDRRLALAGAAQPQEPLPKVRAVSPLSPSFANDSIPSSDARLAFLAPLSAYATVSETDLSGRPGAPLLLIQDVHDNADAQGNIARILQELSQTGPLPVALEGAAGPFISKALKTFPDGALLSRAARGLLDKKILTGAEYASLTAPGDITLWGAEDPALYARHVKAVQDGFAGESALKKSLEELRPRLDELKRKTYPAALLEFDRHAEDYQTGRISLGEYVRSLRPVDGRRPQLSLFLKALDEESSLDFAAAEKERRALIEALSSRLSKADAAALVEESLLFRAGRLTHARFHAALSACAVKSGLSISAFPAFERYIRYVGQAESIDRPVFMGELKALEEEIVRRELAAAPKARPVFDMARDHVLAGKLLKHALTPDEWALYRDRRDGIHALQEKLGGQGSMATTAAPFEAFYEAAEGRNRAMTENFLRLVPPSPQGTGPAAVLVAGGFHTPGLAALLKEKGLSYVVITPRVEKIDGTDYLDVFRPEQAPLEKLFRGEKLTLIRELGLPARAILGAGGVRRYILSVVLPDLDAAARRRGLSVEIFRSSLKEALGADYTPPTGRKSGEEAVFETDDRGCLHKILLSGDETLQAREVPLRWRDGLRILIHNIMKPTEASQEAQKLPVPAPSKEEAPLGRPENPVQTGSLAYWVVKAASRALGERYPIQWRGAHLAHAASRFLDKIAIPLGMAGAWKEANLLAQGARFVNNYAAAAGFLPAGPLLVGVFLLAFAGLHAFLAVYAENRTRGSPVKASAVFKRMFFFLPAFALYPFVNVWIAPQTAKVLHWTVDAVALTFAARPLFLLQWTNRWRERRLLGQMERAFAANGLPGIRVRKGGKESPLPEEGMALSPLDLTEMDGKTSTFSVDPRLMRALAFADPDHSAEKVRALVEGYARTRAKIAAGRDAATARWETARDEDQKDFSYWVENFLAPIWRVEPAFPEDVRDILYLGGAQVLRLVDPKTHYSPRALKDMDGRPTLEKLAHIQWHVVRVTEGVRWLADKWNGKHPENLLSAKHVRALMRAAAYHDLGKFHPRLVHLFLSAMRFPEGSIERKEQGLHEEKSFEVAEDLDGAGLHEAEAALRIGGNIWKRSWRKVALMQWWKPHAFLMALLLSVIDVYDGYCDNCRLYHADWGRGNYPFVAGEVFKEIKRRISPLPEAVEVLDMMQELHRDPEFVRMMKRTHPLEAAMEARRLSAAVRDGNSSVTRQFDLLLAIIRDDNLLSDQTPPPLKDGEAPLPAASLQSSPPDTWWPAFFRRAFLRDIPPEAVPGALRALAAGILTRETPPEPLHGKLEELLSSGDLHGLDGLTREDLAWLAARAPARPSAPLVSPASMENQPAPAPEILEPLGEARSSPADAAADETRRWIERIDQMELELLKVHPPEPIAETIALLKKLQPDRRRGRVRIALATGASAKRMDATLKSLGLGADFNDLYPAPHDKALAIQEVLGKAGISPKDGFKKAVMIGDGSHDIEAGRNAGVRTVLYPDEFAGADFNGVEVFVFDMDGTLADSTNNSRRAIGLLAVEIAGLAEGDPDRRPVYDFGYAYLSRPGVAGLPAERWMPLFMEAVREYARQEKRKREPAVVDGNPEITEEFLERNGVEPLLPGEKIYGLNPGTAAHSLVLQGFVQELKSLPFNNEAGKTLLMRRDAREATERLIRHIEGRRGVPEGKGWASQGTGDIRDIFKLGNLELFKNEIYSHTGIEGAAYNVDLGLLGDGSPFIVLEKFFVRQNPLRLSRTATYRLQLDSGMLILDLSPQFDGNVHDVSPPHPAANAVLPPIAAFPLAGQAGAGSHAGAPSLLDRAAHWPGVAEFLALSPLRRALAATAATAFLAAAYFLFRPNALRDLEIAWRRFRLDRARARMTDEERGALWAGLDGAPATPAGDARLARAWGPVRRLLDDVNPQPDLPSADAARSLGVFDDLERLLLARKLGSTSAENDLLQNVLSGLGERAGAGSARAAATLLKNVQNLWKERLNEDAAARAFHLGVTRGRLAGTPAPLALGEPDYAPSPAQGEVFEISGPEYGDLRSLRRPVPALETLRRTYQSLPDDKRARLRIVTMEDVSAGDVQADLSRYWARFNDGEDVPVPVLPRAELKRRGALRFQWTSLKTVVVAERLALSLGLASIIVRTATPENWFADLLIPIHLDPESVERELRTLSLLKSYA